MRRRLFPENQLHCNSHVTDTRIIECIVCISCIWWGITSERSITSSSAVINRPSEAALWWMTSIHWSDFPTFTYPSPIWHTDGHLLELVDSYLVWKKPEQLGYNLVKITQWSTQGRLHNDGSVLIRSSRLRELVYGNCVLHYFIINSFSLELEFKPEPPILSDEVLSQNGGSCR